MSNMQRVTHQRQMRAFKNFQIKVNTRTKSVKSSIDQDLLDNFVSKAPSNFPELNAYYKSKKMKTNFHSGFVNMNPAQIRGMRERIDQCKTVWLYHINTHILDELKQESKKDLAKFLK